MRIAIVGAGGVGGWLAAHLVQAGADVTVVARGAHAQALRQNGLRVHGPAGEEHTTLPVVVEASQLRGAFDLICLAVKWRDLEAACADAARVIAPYGIALPLLNGLDSEDVVARFVGAQRTLAAVAYMSSGITGPGHIYVHGNSRLGLAPYRLGQEDALEAVAGCFERAQVPVRRQPEYRAMLWEKMVWNAPFNGICALTRRPAGEAAQALERLVRAAMHEVMQVARADGVELPSALADLMLQLTRSDYPKTQPSMLQDVLAGRPTEVDVLQGAVVARADALGVDVPIMRTLTDLVRALQDALPAVG